MLGFALLGEAWTPTANGPLMRRPKTVIKLPLENRDEFFNFLVRSNLGSWSSHKETEMREIKPECIADFMTECQRSLT